MEGLSATASVITSAALIMILVFGIFAFARVLAMQLMGFGLAVAVLLDATVIRMVLVPAFMQAMGRWNWWPGVRRIRPKDGATRRCPSCGLGQRRSSLRTERKPTAPAAKSLSRAAKVITTHPTTAARAAPRASPTVAKRGERSRDSRGASAGGAERRRTRANASPGGARASASSGRLRTSAVIDGSGGRPRPGVRGR